MLTEKEFNAITKEVEKMDKVIIKSDCGKKVKYVDVYNRRYRLTFNWNVSKNKYTIEIEKQRHSIYEPLLYWDSIKNEKSFKDFLYNFFINQPNRECK